MSESGEAAYRARVRELSDRVVAAQRPIRILDAVRWEDPVRRAFLAASGREPPAVTREHYLARPLGFDPAEARRQFEALEREVVAGLGSMNAAGRVLRRMCREYETVLAMLEARGTREFAPLARQLYGATTDVFHAGGPTLLELADRLDGALRAIDGHCFEEDDVVDIPTERAVAILQERLDRVFSDPDGRVRVRESDGIVADAAAGADSIKLRKGALFSDRDLRVLEVHEGWVHVGTSLNGRAQPVCSFLGKGTPSTTITQEGLALLVEVLAFASHPARLRRVIDRTRAIAWAEQGADFLEVYRKLQEEGRREEDAWQTSLRVFRGSLPDAGPFPKDLAYARGFVQVYNFLRLAVGRGRLDRIPLLFCGKIALDEVGTLADLVAEGLVTPPRHLPPLFADLRALSAWMAWSNLLNRLDLARLEADFAPLLS